MQETEKQGGMYFKEEILNTWPIGIDNPDTEVLEKVKVDEKEGNQHEIVLFNDEVNTFDHVIETLILVCEHTPEQAEQCSILVHYKGKCTVKTGAYKELKPKCIGLLDAGLSAEII